jgi:tetratricopeptide (TPR) repeat protein
LRAHPAFAFFVVGATGLMVLSGRGRAMGSEVEDAESRAKQHFDAAEVHYRLGRFEAALDEYTKAYEASPLPAFLFNIGQCHKNLRDHERAIFSYESYLRDAEDSSNRATIEELILDSKRELEAKKQRETAEPKTPTIGVTQDSQTEQVVAAPVMTPPQIKSTTEKTEEAALYERPWFWGVVVGAALLAVGGTVLIASSGGETILVPPSGSLGTVDWR